MKLLSALIFIAVCLHAETGYDAWLRYTPIDDPTVRQMYQQLPATLVTLDSSPVANAARQELTQGIRGMLGRTLRLSADLPGENCILLAMLPSLRRVAPDLLLPPTLIDDGYFLKTTAARGHSVLLIAALNDRGLLYGTFALLRKIALHEQLDHIDEQHNPYAPIRWTNEWDNLDGSIERGYAGRSIFFEAGNVVPDLTRASDYARLLASIGINGCTVNNVNANPRVITTEFLPQLARIADAFRPWGVRLSVAVDFSSPKTDRTTGYVRSAGSKGGRLVEAES